MSGSVNSAAREYMKHICLGIVLLLLSHAVVVGTRDGLQVAAVGDASWPVAGHDSAATNFNVAEQTISRANVRSLRVAWSIPAVTRAIVEGTHVFALAGSASQGWRILILDATSGKILRSITAASLR